jgi:hypothetical protein
MIVPGPRLQLFITYDSHYFEAAAIQGVLQKLEAVLSGIIGTSGNRLSSLLPG